MSPSPATPSRSKSPTKSFSSSNLREISVADTSTLSPPQQPRRMPSAQSLMEDAEHSTIPDPRQRTMTPVNGSVSPAHHPDLDQEVAALSTKLINAINHSTMLDDTLSTTRQELDASKERIQELEALVERQKETLSGDIWVQRKTVEAEKSKLLGRIADEKHKRTEVDKEKKKIEQELENLTVSLFEEANKMVITAKEDAKREQDVLLRKNDQLKAQLADTEGLLKSQQEQLAQLKLVMEQMADQDDHSGTTAPSSPGFSKFDTRDDETQISEGASQPGSMESIPPTYPTNLPHLLQPVLRNDLTSYEDFLSLIQTSKRNSSRISSGSYGGLPILSFNGAAAIAPPSNASTASLSTVGTPASTTVSPQTPNTPASMISAGSGVSSTPLPPLKDSKFYKRVLAEDIEPTLRLDIAPGLSWLARRSVLSAMTEGNLVVEPIPANGPFASISKPQYYPCSLCGESRKDDTHLRNHRFRTNESDSAQRYPLCQYCLARVRSTCDFLGFLRMVKDGHWRADNSDSEKAAWEESVRLRDQMFWCRIGGGVVPIQFTHTHHVPLAEKAAAVDTQQTVRFSEDGNQKKDISKAPEGSIESASTIREEQPSSDEKTSSVEQTTTESVDEMGTETTTGTTTPEHQNTETHAANGSTESSKDRGQRLSLAIPGAFDDGISP
ncbi:hypothetical protein GGR57DRAFT_489904 [Xylariaceae sp. FL1272]|nr:hypothetical protein GGR57DRAFT_489904 [Xylariaceae sp. FL1272]